MAFESEDKIQGGQAVDASEFGFVVRIEVATADAWRPICTGSLIAKDVVLTAAHCLAYGRYSLDGDVRVVQGSPANRETRLVVAAKAHPGYFPEATTRCLANQTGGVDLMMLRLQRQIDVEPIAYVARRPEVGDDVVALGWGFTSDNADELPDALHAAQAVVANQETDDSQRTLRVRRAWTWSASPTCSGDSGGPLVVAVGDAYKLAGVHQGGSPGAGHCLDGTALSTDVTAASSFLAGIGELEGATSGWLEPLACFHPHRVPAVAIVGSSAGQYTELRREELVFGRFPHARLDPTRPVVVELFAETSEPVHVEVIRRENGRDVTALAVADGDRFEVAPGTWGDAALATSDRVTWIVVVRSAAAIYSQHLQLTVPLRGP